LAFAVMVLAEAAMLYVPGVPKRAGVVVTILAMYGAFRFTDSYPNDKSNTSLLKAGGTAFRSESLVDFHDMLSAYLPLISLADPLAVASSLGSFHKSA
jgi:hypothetical protein